MTTECVLPDKPSELLRLALDDLRACEADPHYRVDMGVWHTPTKRFFGLMNACKVCFAGSVMAQTCKIPMEWGGAEVRDGFSRADWRKFDALNAFRLGDVGDAVNLLGFRLPDAVSRWRRVPDYGHDKSGFKEAMESLAIDLEGNGL